MNRSRSAARTRTSWPRPGPVPRRTAGSVPELTSRYTAGFGELVALAVWPTDITLPGPVSRAARTPDIDQRPARKPTSATPPATGVSARGGVSTPQERAQARELFRQGSSIASIADEFGVPWLAARAWCRANRAC